MKNVLLSCFLSLATVSSVLAGYNDIKPGETREVAPTAVAWSQANDAALTAATSDEALAKFVADPVAARGLLLKVRGAYETDPIAACQIAAVSQWVMQDDPWYYFWFDGEHEAGRKVWVNALLNRAEGTINSYVKIFCLDQLRWCGCDCSRVQDRIRAIGDSGDKSVKDFSEVVLRELNGQSIGL